MSKRDSEAAGSLRLTGRVIGPDGQGLAGAVVWIGSLPDRTTTTAGDGTFELDNLSGGTYELRAQAGELIGGPQATRLAERSTPVLIKLREGAHLLVTVVDATRAPIANAVVRVIGNETVATTDSKGEARLTAHPGWVAVEATGEDYAPRRISVTSAASGATSRVTIVLHKGFAVSGRVLDQARKPIPSVRIYARQASGTLTFENDEKETVVTDEAGTFTIPSAIGMHTFLAIDDEHAPASTPMFDIDHTITNLEIVMKPGALYAGSVVDADGKPVAGARVTCEAPGQFGRRPFSTTSAQNGTFEIRGLPRTMAAAWATSDLAASEPVMLKLGEQPELRGQKLTLKRTDAPAGAISGVVVDDTGAPVAEVLVHVAGRRSSPESASGVDTSFASSTRTNVRGEFSIPDLPGGEYGVWPGAFDRPPFDADAARYVAGLDPSSLMTKAKPGDKALRLVMPRAAVVSGKVAFADSGEVVNDFTVDVQPSGDRVSVPGAQGTFELRDLRPGTYTLHIRGPSFLDATKADVRVDAGKTTALGTVAVQRGRTLKGKVIDRSGLGVAGASVKVGMNGVFLGVGRYDEPYFDQPSAVTDANGAFSIVGGIETKALGAGGLVAGADHPAYGRSLPVAIPSGTQDPPPITLTLLDCGSIAGKVTQSGVPIDNAIIGAGRPEYGSATTNEDGEFVLSRMPAGPVALSIHLPSDFSRAHQRTVQVDAGKQTEVAIDIPAGTIVLTVAIKPKAGNEVAGAILYLFSGTVAFENYAQLSARFIAESQGLTIWTGDASQPAKFDRLIPGDYSVCTLPLAWSPNDSKLMKRLYSADRALVKVYCAPARVLAAPEEQSMSVEVPSMAPIP